MGGGAWCGFDIEGEDTDAGLVVAGLDDQAEFGGEQWFGGVDGVIGIGQGAEAVCVVDGDGLPGVIV